MKPKRAKEDTLSAFVVFLLVLGQGVNNHLHRLSLFNGVDKNGDGF